VMRGVLNLASLVVVRQNQRIAIVSERSYAFEPRLVERNAHLDEFRRSLYKKVSGGVETFLATTRRRQ
jgi:hypothetical protein